MRRYTDWREQRSKLAVSRDVSSSGRVSVVLTMYRGYTSMQTASAGAPTLAISGGDLAR
jgi:hypothetical protein